MSNQKSSISRAVVVTLLLIAAVFGFMTMGKDKPKEANKSKEQSQVQQAPQTEVSYKGVEGKNALELLKQSHKTETKTYEGLGEFVSSIDGVAADSKHFWSFYVNDQQSQVGAGTYITKDSDMIMWKLEDIKQ